MKTGKQGPLMVQQVSDKVLFTSVRIDVRELEAVGKVLVVLYETDGTAVTVVDAEACALKNAHEIALLMISRRN